MKNLILISLLFGLTMTALNGQNFNEQPLTMCHNWFVANATPLEISKEISNDYSLTYSTSTVALFERPTDYRTDYVMVHYSNGYIVRIELEQNLVDLAPYTNELRKGMGYKQTNVTEITETLWVFEYYDDITNLQVSITSDEEAYKIECQFKLF